MKLTKKAIEKADKRRKYSDGRGLFLSVSKTGSKTWAFCYTFNSKPREMGLGSIDYKSLNEVRDEAVKLRRMVHDGIDPLAKRERRKATEKRAREIGTKFSDLFERVIEDKRGSWKSTGKSEASWRGSFTHHVLPHFGHRDIVSITKHDIADLLRPIWTTKHVTAKRLSQRLETVFEAALALDLLNGVNPAERNQICALMPDHVHRVRHHPALPFRDMPDHFSTIQSLPNSGVAVKALQLLILTASRSAPIRLAKWENIDMEKKIWCPPPADMKGKKGDDKVHRIPLSTSAIEVLKTVPMEEDNPFVFISPDGTVRANAASRGRSQR